MTPGQKAARTRKRRAAGRKAARTRKQRAAGRKAAQTRRLNRAIAEAKSYQPTPEEQKELDTWADPSERG